MLFLLPSIVRVDGIFFAKTIDFWKDIPYLINGIKVVKTSIYKIPPNLPFPK
jgi:hypothetical protein